MNKSWEDYDELKMLKSDLIDRYDFIEYLGGGGFGKVFKLKHRTLNRMTALKVLKLANFDDDRKEEIEAHFQTEAQAYAKCKHPSIVNIYDISHNSSLPHFFMEYIEGKDLYSLIKEKGKLEWSESLEIAKGVLAGLGELHKNKLVHRDIKPQNIMVNESDGRIVIIDLGIAKNVAASRKSKQLFGTRDYMAPEQFDIKEKITGKTDLYSFGVVLYEMLTGELPSRGSNIKEMNPGVPAGIEKILKKAMAKDVKKRYQAAKEFWDELKKIKTKRRKMILVSLISLAVIVLAALFIIIFNPFNLVKKGTGENQYKQFIYLANEFIDRGEYEKANYYLINAGKMKDKDPVEIRRVLERIVMKKREDMGKQFEILEKFLKGSASEKEKIAKSQEFINEHKNIPKNSQTESMVSEANDFITQLQKKIIEDREYQKHIDDAKDYIEIRDYEKAGNELKKARDIRNTDEVKQLFETIAIGREEERKNGDSEYNAIKDQINLTTYIAFKRKYPDSIHLQDLQGRLKKVDKILPPESYWGQPIKKNRKGYYELKFGGEHNEHIMIYIPGKNYWIDKYEVSKGQFRRFLEPDKKAAQEDDNLPVRVTYGDAGKYCKQYGLKLPNEKEWENAASGGKQIDYPWGNETPDENGIYRANFESQDDGFEETAPVNIFEEFSSPFGVVNMSGNVWEWVQGMISKGGCFLSKKENLQIEKRSIRTDRTVRGFRCLKVEK